MVQSLIDESFIHCCRTVKDGWLKLGKELEKLAGHHAEKVHSHETDHEWNSNICCDL